VLTTNEVVKERMNNDNDNDNGWIGILALSGRLAGWHFGWDSTMLLAPDAVLLMMIRQDGPGNDVHLRSC